MLSARSARQRSSLRPVTRLYLMPASGLNSNVVTTGPGLICDTCAAHVELGTLFAEAPAPAALAPPRRWSRARRDGAATWWTATYIRRPCGAWSSCRAARCRHARQRRSTSGAGDVSGSGSRAVLGLVAGPGRRPAELPLQTRGRYRCEHLLPTGCRDRGRRRNQFFGNRRLCWLFGNARRGMSCAVTTGFVLAAAARFFSSSRAARLRARSARQSAKRSTAA